MLTFAFITLIVILISVSHVYNWLSRKCMEDSDAAGAWIFMSAAYVIINYWVIKYIVIWGAQLIYKKIKIYFVSSCNFYIFVTLK